VLEAPAQIDSAEEPLLTYTCAGSIRNSSIAGVATSR